MKNKHSGHLSDETLNSLVDNEFPVAERAEILAYLQKDEASKRRACEINNLKDRVKTAYCDIPQPVKNTDKKLSKRNSYTVAASLFLGFVILGLTFFGYENNAASQRLVMLDPDGRGQQLSQNNVEEMRVVFHVSNSTRLNADELLDDIES